MIYPCKFGDIHSIGSRDVVHTRICHADADTEKFNSLRPPVTLKMGVTVTKTLSALWLAPVMYQCKFGKIPPLIQEKWWIQTITPTASPGTRTETNMPPSYLWLGT